MDMMGGDFMNAPQPQVQMPTFVPSAPEFKPSFKTDVPTFTPKLGLQKQAPEVPSNSKFSLMMEKKYEDE